ncbi:methylated-DNA-[protein]-cysteine S-methyltransferase [Caldicoprobacter guelmensis]|uniref:methylated-DNA--[protein]-cysteine S-methyltransferase n=1 Tax=Caldicoprobacter guelmensis TaxID=1170224 RepID=UPI00195E18F2|nr:methylated-DNA--[protein]-cysteine S-methyltransferase [Caldicoprobacter guelmensis]MBM7582752.1 methylated-DNA-[protein]-cysteine S-methyltransferase [Caldicoprobacter guelmensis]
MRNFETYIIAQIEEFIYPITIIASARGVREIHFSSLDTIVKKLAQENIPYLIDLSHPAVIELKQYFRGQRKHFGVPVDIEGTPFQMKVWKALQSIPYGQVQSYKEIAEKIGHPKAPRAVGRACGANPVPIIIPCHRVVAASGKLGGFSGGIEIKKVLLNLEGILFK